MFQWKPYFCQVIGAERIGLAIEGLTHDELIHLGVSTRVATVGMTLAGPLQDAIVPPLLNARRGGAGLVGTTHWQFGPGAGRRLLAVAAIPEAPPERSALAQRAWHVSAATAVVVGAIVLVGWLSGAEWLGGLFGTVRMKANTASSFVLLGLGLASLAPERIGRRRKVFGMVCAGVASGVGIATIAEWIFNWDLGIDQLLFTESPGAVGTSEPGRMAATTAICFFLGGTALCLLRVRQAGYAQALGLVLGLLAFMAFAGFVYDVESLRGLGQQTQMAVPTSLTFLVLSLGVLSARSGGLVADLRSHAAGGAAARFLIPAATVVPFVTGWLALVGQDLGLYRASRTHQLLATADIAVLTGVVWVTARLLNRIDAEAQRQRAYIAAIVESAGDAIMTRAPDGRITTWNTSAERLFGYTAAEVIGRRDFFLTPEELRDKVEREVEDLKQSTQPQGIETVQLAKDGRRIPVAISRFRIRGAADSTIGTGILVRDITERKQAEAEQARMELQLRQSQKMEAVGQLAAGVAHDFNNKLAVIIGSAEAAMATLEPAAPARADIDEIRTAAWRSAELTRQLLAFARMQPIAPKQLDLNDTVASMLKMLGRLLGEDVRLTWKPDPQPCWVRMDPGQIDQLLVNLAVNARDAISGTGTVTITTKNILELNEYDLVGEPGGVAGRYVVLEVSDDGCGMDQQTQARAFEPFFTTKSQGQGTGLGLATVHGITHQNHGFVDLYSQVGRGSTIRIYLPGDAERVAAEEASMCGAPAIGSETLLLVEDEPVLLRLTTKVLRQEGFTVLAAARPSEAIELAAAHSGDIDLLVSDVVMPEMNGSELRRRIQAVRPQLRCLFVSGYPAHVLAETGVLGDAVDLLQKPYACEALVVKLREVLARR